MEPVGESLVLLSERLATLLPTEVVTDAQAIAGYYRERYRKSTHFIPYGAESGKSKPGKRCASSA